MSSQYPRSGHNPDRRGINRRVFIVGCPRSGTTVLQRCVAAHSRIGSFPETDFFAKLVGGRKGRCLAWLNRVGEERRARAWEKIGRVFGTDALPDDPVSARRFDTEVDRYVQMLDARVAAQGRDIWLEKTPRHFRYVDLIERAVPASAFVHIVRDGRAVVGSIVDRAVKYPDQFGAERDPVTAARLWNEAIRCTAARIRRSNDMVVRHEALTQSPEQSLRALCAWIGVAYEPGMHEMTAGQSIVEPQEFWKQDAQSGVRPVTDKFEEVVGERDRQRVNKILDWRAFDRLCRSCKH
ncbi:MAG: sulfotransferase [Halofilum sp. (in: g-proteobacteria)]|nr:sulfotransferase [Halofilum sp. (in: g-proteobacteria)]